MEFIEFELLGELLDEENVVYNKTLTRHKCVPEKDKRKRYKMIRKISKRKFRLIKYEYWARTGRWFLLFLFKPSYLKKLRDYCKAAQVEAPVPATQPSELSSEPPPKTHTAAQLTVEEKLLEAPESQST